MEQVKRGFGASRLRAFGDESGVCVWKLLFVLKFVCFRLEVGDVDGCGANRCELCRVVLSCSEAVKVI